MTLEGDSLAQLVEHIPFKDGVLGSNPRRITKGSQFATLFLFIYLLNTAQFKKSVVGMAEYMGQTEIAVHMLN